LIEQDNVIILLVWGPQTKTQGSKLLGLFPLERSRSCLNLPISSLAFWQHRYCFLTVPLVDTAAAWSVLGAFWRWLESNPLKAVVFDTNCLLAEDEFHQIWSDFLIGRCSHTLSEYPRAFLRCTGSSDAYISGNISKKHLDEYRRQERRLQDLGKLTYHCVSDSTEAEEWVENFLRLESSGWKGGKTGGAFANRPADEQFLRCITRIGVEKQTCMLLSLELEGKPIAMKYNFVSTPGSFAFKIAFDEEYGKYSPGALLELKNIQLAFEKNGIDWMDSCAAPRHPMANRLWRERRMVRRTLISTGSRLGDAFVSTLPLLRFIRHKLQSQPAEAYFRVSTKQKESGGPR
jgi:hypothetical protein